MVPRMREFVDRDIAKERRGEEEQKGVDHDGSPMRTAAPLRLGEGQMHGSNACAEGFLVDAGDHACDA